MFYLHRNATTLLYNPFSYPFYSKRVEFDNLLDYCKQYWSFWLLQTIILGENSIDSIGGGL